MKKIFIIFILFFSFFNFSFANDDEKICSKESKTVEPLYWKEVIFDFYSSEILWDKSYSIPQDMKYLFYKDSWFICLEWKILHLNFDKEKNKYSINLKQNWEKILEKNFEFLEYYNAENNIKYNDWIYTWMFWFFFKDEKSDVEVFNFPSWIFDFIYLKNINILNWNEKFKEYHTYSDWKNILVNKKNYSDKNFYKKLKLYEYENDKFIFSTDFWEDFSYDEFIFINYFSGSINEDNNFDYFIIKNKLFLNNWDLIFIKNLENFWILSQKNIKTLNYNFKNFIKIKEKIFYLKDEKIFEIWDYNESFKIINEKIFENLWKKYFFNYEENKIEKLENNDEKYEEIINEKNKNLENFHNKFETNKNLFFSIWIIVFLTILIIILDFRNRKKEKEEFEKLDF